jgi:hypothetical protein
LSADPESAGVYPPVMIQLAAAERSPPLCFFSTATAIGLGTSANEFTVTRPVNEVNSVSCRARSITYRAHRQAIRVVAAAATAAGDNYFIGRTCEFRSDIATTNDRRLFGIVIIIATRIFSSKSSSRTNRGKAEAIATRHINGDQ